MYLFIIELTIHKWESFIGNNSLSCDLARAHVCLLLCLIRSPICLKVGKCQMLIVRVLVRDASLSLSFALLYYSCFIFKVSTETIIKQTKRSRAQEKISSQSHLDAKDRDGDIIKTTRGVERSFIEQGAKGLVLAPRSRTSDWHSTQIGLNRSSSKRLLIESNEDKEQLD